MKIGVYDPYLDSFGGGERYALSFAETFSKTDDVDILVDTHLKTLNIDKILKVSEERFDLDLSAVKVREAPLGVGTNIINRLIFFREYDCVFFVTDGSFFYTTATKNLLHLQVPFKNNFKSIWGRIKLSSWNCIIYNSKFTRESVKDEWPNKSYIVYPPVDVEKIKPLNKGKIILNVGRFSGYLKDKQHELMIDTFKEMVGSDKKLKDWKLVFVGSAGENDLAYVKDLEKRASGANIKLYPNLNFKELVRWYGNSSIYWHAKGYNEKDPKNMEHFGITTVEAMSAGCVPVVINMGGQKEIVDEGVNGYRWDSVAELKSKTINITNDLKLLEDLSKRAIEYSKNYSKDKFCEFMRRIVYDKFE